MEEIDTTDASYFGGVYLRSKESGSWEPIDSAYFSKLDLRIYSEDRKKLHPRFSNLIGKRFSLGFRIKNTSLLTEKEEEFKGMFKLPVKLGEIPSPDLEHLPEAFEMELKQCQDLNFVSNEMADALIRKTLASAFWTFCTPGRGILDQPVLHAALPMLYVDDAHEGYGKELISQDFELDKLTLSYRTCASIVEAVLSPKSMAGGTMEMLEALYKDTTSDLNMSMGQAMELLGKAKKVQNTVLVLKESVLEAAKKHGTNPEPYLKILTSTSLAGCVEVCSEWKKKNHAEMIEAITKIRAHTVFGLISAESIALQDGINLSDRIRSNPLLQIYNTFFNRCFQTSNDVFSYAKESRLKVAGWSCIENEVYLLHKGKGWPLEKALEKVLEDGNKAVEEMQNVADLLLKMHPQDDDYDEHENLKRYIQVTNETYTGCLQWYAFVERYHPGVVYDCYIEE